jgi:beta-phosphoglucomutase-like phosphatase (HAD superfamily)
MQVRAVVFDMDGLMLDTEPTYKAAWQQACTDLGFTLDDAAYARLVGRITEDCETELIQRFGSGFPMSRFRVRWPELWRASVRLGGIQCKPGLLTLLGLLDDYGLPRAIATSSEAEYAEFSLRSAGLGGRFDVVVTSEDVADGKPAPDVFLEAARRLSVRPNDCVALEDSDAGVWAASQAGMTTICVPDLRPPSAAAASVAHRVLGSLDEVRELLSVMLAADGKTGA